jgi:hypothetical protein
MAQQAAGAGTGGGTGANTGVSLKQKIEWLSELPRTVTEMAVYVLLEHVLDTSPVILERIRNMDPRAFPRQFQDNAASRAGKHEQFQDDSFRYVKGEQVQKGEGFLKFKGTVNIPYLEKEEGQWITSTIKQYKWEWLGFKFGFRVKISRLRTANGKAEMYSMEASRDGFKCVVTFHFNKENPAASNVKITTIREYNDEKLLDEIWDGRVISPQEWYELGYLPDRRHLIRE